LIPFFLFVKIRNSLLLKENLFANFDAMKRKKTDEKNI